nr:thiamine phosphate synthase [Methylobacterium sp. BTF04]
MPSPLLVVTDRHGLPSGDEHHLLTILEAILSGGARWIWFRERDMAAESRAHLARDVLGLVRAYGGRLSIGGDAVLAAALGADGVHLSGGAGPAEIADARACLPDGLIGVSAHSPGEVEAASRARADYATLSPIFATASKPGYGPALTPAALTAAARFGIPVIALGGITAERMTICREAGAAGCAVMGGLMRTHDPAGATRAVLDAWAT